MLGCAGPALAWFAHVTYLAPALTDIYGRPYRLGAMDNAGIAASVVVCIMTLSYLAPAWVSYRALPKEGRPSGRSLGLAFAGGALSSIAIFVAVPLLLNSSSWALHRLLPGLMLL